MAEQNDGRPEIANPAYAIDDQTAIEVSDGTVEVISEGHWKPLPARKQTNGRVHRPQGIAALGSRF